MTQYSNREVLIKLYIEEQKPIRTIARELKCGEATILRYLLIHEIPRRPQNQWKGRHLSEESKEKLRIAQTGRKASEETKKKLSLMRAGVPRNRPKVRKTRTGYISEWNPTHPMSNKNGYILQHRRIMSEHLGRHLTDEEVVHHINEDKMDNRIENLKMLSREEHGAIHENYSERKQWQSEQMKRLRAARFWSTKKK